MGEDGAVIERTGIADEVVVVGEHPLDQRFVQGDRRRQIVRPRTGVEAPSRVAQPGHEVGSALDRVLVTTASRLSSGMA